MRAEDLRRCFKDASLRLVGKPARVLRPRAGLVIERDRWGVPHITGKTAADVAFGAGLVTVEDRGLLLELIRGPARAAAFDIPGISPTQLALSGSTLVPSAQGEALLAQQVQLLARSGDRGRRMVAAIQAYVAGLNAGFKRANIPITPYTARDVVAVGALLAARFGANGGSEPRRAMFLDALRKRLGETKGKAVFDDLRAADDAESPTIDPGRFAFHLPPAASPGSVVLDDGSFTAGGALGQRASSLESRPASNALLLGAKRSKSGRPILVGGPRWATSSRSSSWRSTYTAAATTSAARSCRGCRSCSSAVARTSRWTVTSSQGDNIDTFAETLCGGDDRHYLYKGTCREMDVLDAGTLRSIGSPDQRLQLLLTVHGVVQGYATVGRTARRARAATLDARSRGLSARALFALNTGAVTSAASFTKAAGQVEPMFNLFYADDRDIAHVTAGRLPIRAPGTDPALPTIGTGEYDWRGFLGAKAHPQTVNPRVGSDPRLELEAGRGLGRRRRQLVVRLRAAQGAADSRPAQRQA